MSNYRLFSSNLESHIGVLGGKCSQVCFLLSASILSIKNLKKDIYNVTLYYTLNWEELFFNKGEWKVIAPRIKRKMLRGCGCCCFFWPYRYMRNGHIAMKYMYYLAQESMGEDVIVVPGGPDECSITRSSFSGRMNE